MIAKRYTEVSTSFGTLYLTAENGKLIRISTDHPHAVNSMRRDDLPLLTESADQIKRYLEGEILSPHLTVTISSLDFPSEVYTRIAQISYGDTVTSAFIAEEVNHPQAVKAVEILCRTNPLAIAIPTHRVLLSEGISGDRGIDMNEALRRLEKRYLDKGIKRG